VCDAWLCVGTPCAEVRRRCRRAAVPVGFHLQGWDTGFNPAQQRSGMAGAGAGMPAKVQVSGWGLHIAPHKSLPTSPQGSCTPQCLPPHPRPPVPRCKSVGIVMGRIRHAVAGRARLPCKGLKPGSVAAHSNTLPMPACLPACPPARPPACLPASWPVASVSEQSLSPLPSPPRLIDCWPTLLTCQLTPTCRCLRSGRWTGRHHPRSVHRRSVGRGGQAAVGQAVRQSQACRLFMISLRDWQAPRPGLACSPTHLAEVTKVANRAGAQPI